MITSFIIHDKNRLTERLFRQLSAPCWGCALRRRPDLPKAKRTAVSVAPIQTSLHPIFASGKYRKIIANSRMITATIGERLRGRRNEPTRTRFPRNLFLVLEQRLALLKIARFRPRPRRCWGFRAQARATPPIPAREAEPQYSLPPSYFKRPLVICARRHRIRITVRFLGPWAPKTRIRSMSPVRLGPVMNVIKLG
jgi:hypothetical protein